MAHHDFSRPQVLWTPASVPNARDFHHWDASQFGGLDGDNGGTWSPTSPINIGGAGLQLHNGSVLSGGVTTSTGGRMVLGANDFPTFVTSRPRVVRFPLRGLSGGTGVQRGVTSTVAGRTITRFGWFDPSATTVWFPIDQRYIHNGANIAQITFTAFIANAPAPTPSTIFQVQFYDTLSSATFVPTAVWQASHSYPAGTKIIPSAPTKQTGLYYSTSGGTSNPISEPPWPTILGGTTPDNGMTWTAVGYAGTIPMPSPFSVQAYYNNGQAWTVQLTPDVSLPADASHMYALVVTQDTASWVYASASISYTGIPNMAFE